MEGKAAASRPTGHVPPAAPRRVNTQFATASDIVKRGQGFNGNLAFERVMLAGGGWDHLASRHCGIRAVTRPHQQIEERELEVGGPN